MSLPMTRSISPTRDLIAVGRLARQLRQLRPHLVHAHTPKAGLVGMLAAHVARVPVRVYHLHGLRFETSKGCKRSLLQAAERLTCSLANQIYCVSPSLKRRALEESLGAAERFAVLADGSINGLDVPEFRHGLDREADRLAVRQRFGIPRQARCIGFVGRLVRDKGIVDLHDAWLALREHYPDLHLLLVGPFERGDAVPAHIRNNLTRDPRVHLTGLDWNVRPYYSAMDVFTLPSHREGLGNVLLEAAAMELPTVTCRVTGCVDAIDHGVTGQLVAPQNAVELGRAIRFYLDSPRHRTLHGQAGRRRVETCFRPERIWESMFHEYLRLLAAAPRVAAVSSIPSWPRQRAA